jgi:hypothetical protein
MDFNKIDLSRDNWYSFLNILEDKPEICISGNDKSRHKVKHFTYLYGLKTKEIIKIGTSYYKHHIIKNHIKNEILLTVLREIVEYKWAETVVVNLEDKIKRGIGRFIDNKTEYFERKKSEILFLEDQETKENMIYYDYNLQIESLKRDIIELLEVFNYDFLENIERIESIYSIDSNIENKLDNIKNEIIELLGSEEYPENIFLEETMREPSETELQNNIDFESVKECSDSEAELQNNIELEEIIKNELEQQENEFIDYLIFEEKFIEYYIQEKDELKESWFIKRKSKQSKEVLEMNKRLERMRNNIIQFKIDIAVYQNNIYHLNKSLDRYIKEK